MGKIIEFRNGKERKDFLMYHNYFTDDPFWADFDLPECITYAAMLNQMIIAAYNKQFDSHGKLYCNFTIDDIMKVARCKATKAKAILKKLKDRKLIRVERPNKRAENMIYVREYIPDDEKIMAEEQPQNKSENDRREGRQTTIKAKNYNNKYYSLSKIRDSRPVVKRKFNNFEQRQYSSSFYADLEKAMCGSG